MSVIGFAVSVIVPAVMVFWGRCLQKDPPEYLKGRFSFRTKRARKNEEIWNYSNRFFSHMIVTAGINCGLVSVVFYIGSVFLTDGRHWAAAALALFCVQAVCVLLIYRITDFILAKTYEESILEEEAENEENDGVKNSESDNDEQTDGAKER